MKCNVGGIDRIARIVIGIVLVAIGIFAGLDLTWKIVVFVLAAIMFLTAAVSFCPINAAIGLNTCGKK